MFRYYHGKFNNYSPLKNIFSNKNNEMTNIFSFFCKKIKVELKRLDYKFGDVDVYTMSYNEFNPTDYLDKLTELEKERYFTFTHIQRKREFVATRILRHQVFGFEHIHYDEVGAPYINQEGYISISHTKNLVGFALSKKFKIGFDLEKAQAKILKIKHKFISTNEERSFNIESIIELTKIWSAKETLYKLSGVNGLNFRKDLELEKTLDNQWKGKITTPSHIKITTIQIIDINDTIFTLNITPCE